MDARPIVSTRAFDAYPSMTWPALSNLGDRNDESKRGKQIVQNSAGPGRKPLTESNTMIGLIILIALPLIEIAVLIKVGQWIGFWPVLGLVIATFLLGSAILGRSGLSSAIKVREALARGEPPVGAMLDSSMVVVAAILLITPGLIADAFGLLLLIPPVRHALAQLALRNAIVVGTVKTERDTFHDAPRKPSYGGDEATAGGSDGPVIEGEFERLDEQPVNRPRRDPPSRQ